LVRFEFETTVISWRGPAPYVYAPIPPDVAAEIKGLARLVTYGWGMVPVEVSIGPVVFRTSLFPKDGTYLLPLKVDARRRANITVDDVIRLSMTVRPADR